MVRQPVSSSNLASVGYDPDARCLEIEFIRRPPKRRSSLATGTTIYCYHDVPASVFNGLMEAPSKGKYHHIYIKYGYGFTRGGWPGTPAAEVYDIEQ
jgi:hypothetical protein